jgi:Ser/Thr protein kinase RdoA (MazF antagonist)
MNKTINVTYSTLSTDSLITEVLSDYDIDDILACQFFTGGFNDTYQVKSFQGSTYYLRVYRFFWRSLPDVLFELDVLNHLDCKGFPAIRPLPRRHGSLYWELNAPEGKRYAVLFTEAPGKLLTYDKEPEKVAFTYGQACARLHNATVDFVSPHQRFHTDIDLLIDQPLRNIAPFLAHRPVDLEYLQCFAADLRQRIVELPESYLEWGFCHGDLQGDHANVDINGKLTFFDFDCCGYGYRAYDLAVFRWFTRLEKHDPDWWGPYLQGYRTQRYLSELDEQAIPLFVGARYIWHMGVHTQNAVDWGCSWLGDQYFDEKLENLRRVENDYFANKN